MRRLALVAMLGGVWCGAQQPVATIPVAPATPLAAVPLVSPQAAYDDSTRPVDIVRKSISNWSDVEMNALGVAMQKAAIACGERKPAMYKGDDLVALSRLCSFGQNWPASRDAAAMYIGAEDAGKTQLSLAYGLQLDAVMHMHDLKEIIADAKAMLAGVPYDANVNEAADGAISYLQLAFTDQGIALEKIRQPLLLAALGAGPDAKVPAVPRRSLYASGLEEAELLQYMNRPVEAAASVAALDAALGDEAKLSADDLVPIGVARKQYGLLGNPLPKVTLSMSLANPTEVPEMDPKFGAGTALLLFPDWCAQCVALHGSLWKAEQTQQGIVRLYVLLAEKTPDKAAMVEMANAPAPKAPVAPVDMLIKPEKLRTPAELLLNTQSFVVPTETTSLFAAGDFPFVVMVDHAGIVRFAGSAPETVLRPGDFLDRLVEHVAEYWPPTEASKLNTDQHR